MKYVVILGDGMSDYPVEELNNRTPLQAAKKPNIDFIAKNGVSGMLKTIQEGFEPGSDVANLSVLGYDVRKCHTGRAPIEAANIGINLSNDEVAFRCNFFTEECGILKDYSAGHITSDEGKILINLLNENLSDELKAINGKFYAGVSYRNILVCKAKDANAENFVCIPPHNIVGEKIEKNLITVKNDAKSNKGKEINFTSILNQLMLKSKEILEKSEINKKREIEGKNKANMIWFWGQGKKPKIEEFKVKYNLRGAVISAVDLIKGIGKLAGMDVIEVKGATGLWDTNYDGKATACIEALDEHDFVYVHVEATDEAGHLGDLNLKILSIENLDKMTGKILLEIEKRGIEAKIAILPDHATPINIKTHTSDLVPFAIYSTKNKDEKDEVEKFDEFACRKGKYGKGVENFMEILLKESKVSEI
ncbi:2,3-bisphosphoglycerate-independent phosphoglycerate mutase [groundwater metagenome]|uniref:2,3-bisphosphoglycerate-independent phosphoglycerate mutase n=1 Tax=groundwater metagenome TaxID=717931 RepID=A0A098EB20_9ZZZZ